MRRLAEHLVAFPYRRFCGRMLQGYHIEKVMGVGGSGVAFSACAPDGSSVVLKLLRPLRATYDYDAIWHEVVSFDSVNHPALPEWLGILREGRAYFIVMSQMPGLPFSSWLFEQHHVFANDELVRAGMQLIDALDCLHAAGIAHGDIRPANILYDGSQVSLVDFGMSGVSSLNTAEFLSAKAADCAGFADVMLYLLYSRYNPTKDKKIARNGVFRQAGVPSRQDSAQSASWREELPLTATQRQFLEDIFTPLEPKNMSDIRRLFVRAFGRCDSNDASPSV